jgi:quercetin dioxygenase-like cupin family protein
MYRLASLFVIVLLSAADQSMAQPKVDARGISSKVILEEVVFGHLLELNSKFKMRVTEVTFSPDGYVGAHHHVGPGVRYVASGELTFAAGGKTTIYKAGDYFYETGNLAHTAHNKGKSPLRLIFIEVLPADWTGPAIIPPKA